jgi:hypothetical protein
MGNQISKDDLFSGIRRISTIRPFTIVKPGWIEEKLQRDKIQKWLFN